MRSRARATEASDQRPANWRRGIGRVVLPMPVPARRLLRALMRTQVVEPSPPGRPRPGQSVAAGGARPRRRTGREGP
jgi:hypothetical protein